jgi:hypothetical protein
MAFGFGVLLAPGHGAEANGGDADVGSSERAVFGQERMSLEKIGAKEAEFRRLLPANLAGVKIGSALTLS